MKKIVLSYSGGLDTSIILRWLQENYKAEVIAYTSDIGQVIDRKKIIRNAKRLGVKKIIIEDLKNVFVKDYVFPMLRAHALYEGTYLLGTSIARPLIAKRQIEIAKKYGAYAVSHGATGKGNDQVRFELGYALVLRQLLQLPSPLGLHPPPASLHSGLHHLLPQKALRPFRPFYFGRHTHHRLFVL